ncbi:MAG: hypothetical protein ABL958_04690 [Bdellovibrionia bacterium]
MYRSLFLAFYCFISIGWKPKERVVPEEIVFTAKDRELIFYLRHGGGCTNAGPALISSTVEGDIYRVEIAGYDLYGDDPDDKNKNESLVGACTDDMISYDDRVPVPFEEFEGKAFSLEIILRGKTNKYSVVPGTPTWIRTVKEYNARFRALSEAPTNQDEEGEAWVTKKPEVASKVKAKAASRELRHEVLHENFEVFDCGPARKEHVIRSVKEFRQVVRDWPEKGFGDSPFSDPRVDFSKFDLIVVTEARASSGSEFELQKLTEEKNEIRVQIDNLAPGPKCTATQSVDCDRLIIKVEKLKKKLKFFYKNKTKTCA